ncbi:carbamoyltransferase C-terminal domain-containing protein [Lacrimispora brassicae]
MKTELNDGYYLAVYSDVDPIFHIMNLSLRHDHNMALFKKNGKKIELIHHWEFERISGLKHHKAAFYDKEAAISFINQLLYEYSITLDDMQEVFGMPELSTCDDYHSITQIPDISYHAVCHMFASMIMDTDIFYHETIISLAYDAGPDYVVDKNAYKKEAFCGCVSIKGNLEVFPIPSPGPYWYYLSVLFKKPEGTLMALAYATTTKLKKDPPILPDIYRVKDITKNVLILRQFTDWVFTYSAENMEEICTDYDNRFSEDENKISMIMKFIQEMSLKSINDMLADILKKYQINSNNSYISLSGGYALNCPTNTNIIDNFGFKGQLCCPCLNDSGIAIGMGLYYFYKKCDVFQYQFKTSFYSNCDDDLTTALNLFEPFIKDVYEGIDRAADDIINEPIVWFDGRGEVGPRALGHRSILANPAKLESKDLLNIYKKREWWRPVAPIILENQIDEWFLKSFSSPYMLNNFQIKPEKRGVIEAVLHLDGSARVQTIAAQEDDKLFLVITSIYEKTGIPIICNTSLNDRGEPIVNKIPEAFNFALRKGIRIVYVNGSRIEFEKHDDYLEDKPLERDHQYFTQNAGNEELLASLNPFRLDFNELNIYKINEVLQDFDLTSEREVIKLKKIIKQFKSDFDMYGNLLT